ncbi:hypothetical protein B0H39_000836 [Clostridium beijerinckii]|uniref:hypothetical protein n=1 Tax=Clostridium beijerinckii TaxID=1520 RepID=UPI00040919EE|nr:hypothetical protein [Clostridium beijerinckii]NOW82955.1 hypothetical protein [Clostridium beijerinckii]
MCKKERKPIGPRQKKRLLEKNAYVCCVCKSKGIGLNFHHLDEDPSNNSDDNIAVLCVKEHDNHHRPNAYSNVKHLDLSTEEIRKKKESWESFVNEAKKDNPTVLAVVTAYGTVDNILGTKLVFQWVNGKIEFERVYQLLDAPMDVWADKIIEEIIWVGKNIKLVLINEPVPIEYCDNCNGGALSRILDENMAIKETAVDWDKESLCTIYINPKQSSLAYTIFYKNDVIYQANIHKCGDELHFIDDKRDIRCSLLTYKVRTQVVKFLKDRLKEWDIKSAIIGTGNPDDPDIINNLTLPSVWENWSKKNKKRIEY